MASSSNQVPNGWHVVGGSDIKPDVGTKMESKVDPEVNAYGLTKLNEDERFFPVAVVGIGCRVPGVADHWELREILKEKLTTYAEIPAERWSREEWYSGEGAAKLGYTNSHHAGFLPDIFEFDYTFFRTSPKEAAGMDAQQMQVMEVTQEALHDAGMTEKGLPINTAAYISMKMGEGIIMNCDSRTAANPYVLTGGSHTTTPNRVSFFYDLRGASMGVEGSCSSAMHSAHFGAWSLWNKECDAAIVGGVNYILSPHYHMQYCEHEMLSKKGVCNPFDATADGRIRSEACCILILKPLADALRNKDHVHCVIRASAVGYHAKSLGMGEYDESSIVKVMSDMTERFGIPAEKVDFMEANASGIAEIDRMEAEALGKVFGGEGRKAPLKLGSYKANVGHTEIASGITQMIKAALMCEYREFYGQPHFANLDPAIRGEELQLEVQRELEKFTEDRNMLVGINCFSFSGQIVHMLMEEFKTQERVVPPETSAGWRFGAEDMTGRVLAVPLSAKGKAALKATARVWIEYDNPDEDAQVVVSWLATRRDHYANRITVLANSSEDFRAKLQDFVDDKSNDDVIEGAAPVSFTKPKICFVFPGQGQQWWDMGRQLFATEPVYRDTVQLCDGIWQREAGYSFLDRDRIFVADKGDKPASTIDDFTVTLPSVVVHELALATLMMEWGVQPDLVVGHSLGEMAAAYFNGGLTLDEAVTFLCHRAMALSKVVGNGTMAAVRFTPEQADEFVKDYDDIFVGCYNSTESVTLSGKTETLQRLAKEMPTKVKIIRVTLANHTIFLRPAKDDFMRRTEGKYETKIGGGPQLYSAVTGDVYSGPFDSDFWWTSIEKPVYFTQACQAIFRDCGNDVVFLEIASSATLLSLIRQTAKAMSVTPTGFLPFGLRGRDDRKAVLKGLSQMHLMGFELDWTALTRDCAKYVRLPRYPFQRTYYRLQSELMRQRRLGIDDKSYVGVHGECNVTIHPFLGDYEVRDQLVLPSSAAVEFLVELISGGAEQPPTITDIEIPFHPEIGRLDSLQNYKSLWLEPHRNGRKVILKTKPHWASTYQTGVTCSQGSMEEPDSGLPTSLDTASLKSRCSLVLERSEIYDAFREGGLKYGPEFRIIEEIHIGEAEALGILTTHSNKHETIQTVTLDAAFQVAHMAFVQSLSSVFFVRSIQRLQMNIPRMRRNEKIQVYARLTNWNTVDFCSDIYVLDCSGNVLVAILGCQFETYKPPGGDVTSPISCCYTTEHVKFAGSTDGDAQALLAIVRGRDDSALSTAIRDEMAHANALVLSLKEFISMPGDRSATIGVVYLWNPKNAIYRHSRGNLHLDGSSIDFSDVTDVLEACEDLAGDGIGVKLSVVLCDQHQEEPAVAAYLRSVANATSRYSVNLIHVTRGKVKDRARDVITALLEASGCAEVVVKNGELYRPTIRRLGGLKYEGSNQWEMRTGPGGKSTFTIAEKAHLEAEEVRVKVQAFAEIEATVQCSGTVEEIGRNVKTCNVGDDVIVTAEGKVSRSVICPAADVIPKPKALGWTTAASLGITQGVAHYVVEVISRLRSDQTLYVAHPLTAFGRACLALALAKKCKVICPTGKIQFPDVKMVDPSGVTLRDDLANALEGDAIDVIITQERAVPDDVISFASADCALYLVCFKSAEDVKFSMENNVSVTVVSVPDLIQRRPSLYRSSTQAAVNDAKAGRLGAGSEHDYDVILGQPKKKRARGLNVCSIPDDFRPVVEGCPPLRLDPEATYLVLGGYGGVGQEVAKWLAAKGARHLALVSRRGRTTVYQRFTSQRLVSHGVTIREMRIDLTQESEVVRLLDQLGRRQGFPPLRGIFHAACPMTSASASSSPETLERLTRTQANSARLLHQEVARRGFRLDHFVLLSCSAQLFGQPGLASLAASGAALDALARERRDAGLPALSLQLGLVQGAGYFDCVPGAAAMLSGMRPLPIQTYLDALERLMTATEAPPVVSVVNQDWAEAAKQCPRTEDSFRHFVTGRETDEQKKTDAVKDTILQRLTDDLFWSRDEIDPEVALRDLGYEIYLIRGLIAWCQRKFNVTVTVDEIEQGLTSKELTGRILSTL